MLSFLDILHFKKIDILNTFSAPVIQNGVKWSEALGEQFKKNHDFDMSSKWQYFCSSDGFFRVYPGRYYKSQISLKFQSLIHFFLIFLY
jgi:hypothetical protein